MIKIVTLFLILVGLTLTTIIGVQTLSKQEIKRLTKYGMYVIISVLVAILSIVLIDTFF